MVMNETNLGYEQQKDLQQTLASHWMYDPTVILELSQSLPQEGIDVVNDLAADVELNPEGIQKRDQNRAEVTDILRGQSDKKLIIIGPCSLDLEADYTKLFDYIEKLQVENPDAVIAWRGNGAKPRSGVGNTGTWSNIAPGSRKRQLEIYQDAFARGIPILTEITEKDQFSQLAPYLTAAWAGARDMESTDLRKVLSATRMPVLVKNSKDGRLKSLWDAIKTIRSNTAQNDGSGVNLGYIAATCRHEDGGPASFTVGEGNPNVGIIARGYELRQEVLTDDGIILEEVLSADESEAKAFQHLNDVCTLAARLSCKALLDGSHRVPSMFSLEDKNENRFLAVLKKFRHGVKQERIQNAELLIGLLGEISVSHGKTDKNLVLTPETEAELEDEIIEFKRLSATV